MDESPLAVVYYIRFFFWFQDTLSESQQIELEFSYPRRNVTAIGSYNFSRAALASDLSLTWDKHTQVKNVEGAFNWNQISAYPNHQQALFEIRHPSFEKNVTFLGEYQSDLVNLADVKLEVEYALDPEKKVEFHANLQDHCRGEFRNYTFNISGTHPATNLELMFNGGLDYYAKYYHTFNEAQYKRTYLPLQSSDTSATINIRGNEIEIKVSYLNMTKIVRGVAHDSACVQRKFTTTMTITLTKIITMTKIMTKTKIMIKTMTTNKTKTKRKTKIMTKTMIKTMIKTMTKIMTKTMTMTNDDDNGHDHLDLYFLGLTCFIASNSTGSNILLGKSRRTLPNLHDECFSCLWRRNRC